MDCFFVGKGCQGEAIFMVYADDPDYDKGAGNPACGNCKDVLADSGEFSWGRLETPKSDQER